MNDENRRDETNESWIETMRAEYNAPPETPREAMWAEIEPRLDRTDPDVIPLDPGYRPPARKGLRRWMTGVAAATRRRAGGATRSGRCFAGREGSPDCPAPTRSC